MTIEEEAFEPEASLDEVTRRDALKQGVAAVAAGSLAFSAPKVQGLAVQPKYGAALSQIKKRKRCRVGRIQFRCQPSSRHQRRKNAATKYYNGDPEGTCTFKGGLKGHNKDFQRPDISQQMQYGTCEGQQLPVSYIVAQNTGNACPVILRFANPLLKFSRLSFASAINCWIPSDVYQQSIAGSGSCELPLMWQTPSWATGTKTVTMSASFEEKSVNDAPSGK